MPPREILAEQLTTATVLGSLGLGSGLLKSLNFGLRFSLNTSDFLVEFDGVPVEFRAWHRRPGNWSASLVTVDAGLVRRAHLSVLTEKARRSGVNTPSDETH